MQTGRTAEDSRKQEETEEKMSLPFVGRRCYLSGRCLAASAALVVVLVVTLVGPAGAAAQQASWAGTWDTSYGRMVLSQTGSTVTGRYESCTGRVTGTVSGARLSGTWVEQL